MLKIKNLTKKYGDKVAVNNLSLEIKSGEIYGFIGHNGAGKTTTIKSCCGLLEFDEGEIYVDGISIKEDPLECKRRLSYLPDNPDLYDFVINPPLADRNEYHGHPALNPIVICQNGEFSTYPILLPLEYSDLAGRVVGDAILDNWWRLYDMSDPVKAKGTIKNWETDIYVEDVGKELFYMMGEIVDLIPLPDGKTFAEHGYNALEHVVALYLIGLNIPVFEFFDLIDNSL